MDEEEAQAIHVDQPQGNTISVSVECRKTAANERGIMNVILKCAEWIGDAWCRFAHAAHDHTRPIKMPGEATGEYRCLVCFRRWESPW